LVVSCEHNNKHSGSIKGGEFRISLLPEKLLASEEGVYNFESVSQSVN